MQSGHSLESKLRENKFSSRRQTGTAFVRRFLTSLFATLKTHHQMRHPASPCWAGTSSHSQGPASGWTGQGRAIIPTMPDSLLGSWRKALQMGWCSLQRAAGEANAAEQEGNTLPYLNIFSWAKGPFASRSSRLMGKTPECCIFSMTMQFVW